MGKLEVKTEEDLSNWLISIVSRIYIQNPYYTSDHFFDFLETFFPVLLQISDPNRRFPTFSRISCLVDLPYYSEVQHPESIPVVPGYRISGVPVPHTHLTISLLWLLGRPITESNLLF